VSVPASSTSAIACPENVLRRAVLGPVPDDPVVRRCAFSKRLGNPSRRNQTNRHCPSCSANFHAGLTRPSSVAAQATPSPYALAKTDGTAFASGISASREGSEVPQTALVGRTAGQHAAQVYSQEAFLSRRFEQ
jgi:hypothetical protein